MKSVFSTSWKSSKQPRKQRKYRYNAPYHIVSKFLNVNLSKELRKKYQTRSVRVRSGDKVKVMVGGYRKHVGKVEKVDPKNSRVFVEKVEIVKKDGNKVMKPLEPSNLQIIELNTKDKRMFKRLQKDSTGAEQKKPAKVKAPVKEDKKKEGNIHG